MKNYIKEINTISPDGHFYSLDIPSVSITGSVPTLVPIYTIMDVILFHFYSKDTIQMSLRKEADILKPLLCGTLVETKDTGWKFPPRGRGQCFFVDGNIANGAFL
jgi:hypothetical protein